MEKKTRIDSIHLIFLNILRYFEKEGIVLLMINFFQVWYFNIFAQLISINWNTMNLTIALVMMACLETSEENEKKLLMFCLLASCCSCFPYLRQCWECFEAKCFHRLLVPLTSLFRTKETDTFLVTTYSFQ